MSNQTRIVANPSFSFRLATIFVHCIKVVVVCLALVVEWCAMEQEQVLVVVMVLAGRGGVFGGVVSGVEGGWGCGVDEWGGWRGKDRENEVQDKKSNERRNCS